MEDDLLEDGNDGFDDDENAFMLRENYYRLPQISSYYDKAYEEKRLKDIA